MKNTQINSSNYLTKDLGEASALIVKGVNLIRLEKESNFYWFVFQGSGINEISNDYWSGKLQTSAKKYYDQMRSLKDRLFAQR